MYLQSTKEQTVRVRLVMRSKVVVVEDSYAKHRIIDTNKEVSDGYPENQLQRKIYP